MRITTVRILILGRSNLRKQILNRFRNLSNNLKLTRMKLIGVDSKLFSWGILTIDIIGVQIRELAHFLK